LSTRVLRRWQELYEALRIFAVAVAFFLIQPWSAAYCSKISVVSSARIRIFYQKRCHDTLLLLTFSPFLPIFICMFLILLVVGAPMVPTIGPLLTAGDYDK
jgi:hypothetical protein